MFESLTESINGVFSKLGRKGKLSEKNIQDGLREVRMALLQADVHFKVVKDFIKSVTEQAIGEEVIKSVKPAQQIIKIVHDELISLMGPGDPEVQFADKPPTVIMMSGLQGGGKTTTCAKLALKLKKAGKKPFLVAADMQRPGAVEQLHTLGRQIDVPVYSEESGRPPKICRRGVKEATKTECDVVILDTAGRLHVDVELMDELKTIADKTNPDQIYLVCDAMTGQDAVNSADAFNKELELDGVILTKLDGDARGGAALSVKAVTGKPIKFVGTGEKLENFEAFHPDRMASRILGMGDVVSLVERAQEAIDEDQAKRMQEKLARADFNFQDFLEQLEQVEKMGPLQQVMGMIPGLGGAMDDFDENEFRRMKAIIQSMSNDERQHPEILNGPRRMRIARGSGTSVREVNTLLKQFKDMRKLLKKFKGGKGLMGKMLGGIPGMR